MRRQVPTLATVKELLPRPGIAAQGNRRLARANTIADLRSLAQRRTPRPVFDYVEGAAEDEIALAEARATWRAVRFNPHTMRDVSVVDPSTTMFDLPSALPLVMAPTGFTRMMRAEGEPAVAAAAARAGVPYTMSTLSTTSIEDVRAAVPNGRLWFQLYVARDRGISRELILRAHAAGADTLLLTVDTAVAGARHRDARNGLTFPPAVTTRSMMNIARHPQWWYDLLTTEPLAFANMPGTMAMGEVIAAAFDPTVSIDDLEWLRELWPGSLVVKGIQRVDDALLAVERGADGVVLSHHGGRQLDRVSPPLLLVPHVVDAIGSRAEVCVDSGIMSGADIVAAVAAGATGCLVGRAYLYGLMAGGEAGVDRTLEILRRDVVRTMALLGAGSVAELTPDLVSLPSS